MVLPGEANGVVNRDIVDDGLPDLDQLVVFADTVEADQTGRLSENIQLPASTCRPAI